MRSSHASRDLPIPPIAGDRDQARLALSPGGVQQLLEHPQLFGPADERRLDRHPVGALALGHHAQGAPGADRLALALQLELARILERDRRVAGAAGSPRRRARRRARRSDCSRDAVFTMSPGDHALVVGAERCAASPVSTPRAPAAAGDPDLLTERGDRVDELQRRADRPLGVVLRVTGVPHTAMTASPMNFSTIPPWRSITVRAVSK